MAKTTYHKLAAALEKGNDVAILDQYYSYKLMPTDLITFRGREVPVIQAALDVGAKDCVEKMLKDFDDLEVDELPLQTKNNLLEWVTDRHNEIDPLDVEIPSLSLALLQSGANPNLKVENPYVMDDPQKTCPLLFYCAAHDNFCSLVEPLLNECGADMHLYRPASSAIGQIIAQHEERIKLLKEEAASIPATPDEIVKTWENIHRFYRAHRIMWEDRTAAKKKLYSNNFLKERKFNPQSEGSAYLQCGLGQEIFAAEHWNNLRDLKRVADALPEYWVRQPGIMATIAQSLSPLQNWQERLLPSPASGRGVG